MITVEQYLNQWKVNYGSVTVDMSQLTDDMKEDAAEIVRRANVLLAAFGTERSMTSGWRPAEVNARVSGAAAKSKHMMCQAIDLADPDGDLDDFCFNNTGTLKSIGLWLEHPAATKGWCHVQIVPPRSGNRIFYP